jgi:hypothetical protein
MQTRAVQRLAFRTVSQTGIHYGWSTLSQSSDKVPEGAPRPGDRFPWLHLRFSVAGPVEDSFQKLDDTKFNLLVFGQPVPPGALGPGDLLAVHAIASDPMNDKELARAGIPSTSYYLLRPDGHVGLCGSVLAGEMVRDYFDRRLRAAVVGGGPA